jgi:tRNA pseudouridine55 synthase
VDCFFPSYEQIEQVITHHFTGSLEQVPPSYSAIWIDGKRSYELALRGEEVNLSSRSIEAYSHEILEYCAPIIKLRCRVSSGTYIRSFARDIANCLQTGGVITHLKRTHIGPYSLSGACDIEDVSRDRAYPLEYFFPLSETIVTTPSQLKDIKN